MKTSAATTEPPDLIFDPAEIDAARVIAVLVPGALSRVGIFEAARAWRERGYGLVFYRFPGLDGRSLHPALDLAQAAADIAALLARYPLKPIRLLGYSTGTAIVLKAAARLPERDLRLAVMAPAVVRGGGLQTTWRVFCDVLRAALAERDLRVRPVWFSFYRVLLYGRSIYRDASLAERAASVIDARRSRIVVPTQGLVRSHTRDLKRWRLSGAERSAGRGIGIFWGSEDALYDEAQVRAFAEHFQDARVTTYAGHGHLLFATCPQVFDDILSFFEGADAVSCDPHAPPGAGLGAGISE